jgi:hypothetical protein
LTAGQRWLVHLLEQAPGLARPVQRIYRLRRPVNTVALLGAFRHVVSAQPALRLRLVRAEKGLAQAFPKIDGDISGLRIQGRDATLQHAFASHIVALEPRRTLDLGNEPPFLLKVLEWDDETWLSVCLDHIAADDWAADIFERELGGAYARELRGELHEPSPAASALYACLEREAAQREREPANLAYWRSQLMGIPLSRLDASLPLWVPATTHRFGLSADALGALVRACRSRQCSPFAAVVAALVALLLELTQNDELVINVPVSGRTQASDHTVIMNLSMLLHLRFRKADVQLGASWLRHVRNQLMEAMAHRQFEYAALGDAVATDAASRGGEVHFRTGISYIIERNTDLASNLLFEARIDESLGADSIPRACFTVACRESTAGLKLTFDRDAASWPITNTELEQRYLKMLGAIVDLPLTSSGILGASTS